MRESLRRLASDEGTESGATGNVRRVRVELLDGDFITVDLDRKSRGEHLLDKICDNLDLVERDYFGLYHTQRGDTSVWVDLNRRLSKTFRNEVWEVRFAVRFYPPEPGELRDEHARYQLTLAVHKDLMEGQQFRSCTRIFFRALEGDSDRNCWPKADEITCRLTCSAITLALLTSYSLQAQHGDYSPRLSPLKKAPGLEALHDEKVDELYRKHKGQTPAEAELNYLENAKRLPLYGASLHDAQDCDDVNITLAVSANGISVYRDGLQMNRFPWAKIIKICYNKRAYTLKLRASEFDDFETHLTFRLPSTRACKKLWRCSVDHHIFFRREAPVRVGRASLLPRMGAWRVSCRRTLRQLRDNAHSL